MRRIASFFGASLALSIALFAGRLAGLFREIELAKIFGVGPDADAAIILLSLPDLLVNLLISGGLSAALVPRFLSLNASQSAALFRQVSFFVVLIFIPLSLITVFFPDIVFRILAPGVTFPQTIHWYYLVAIGLAIPLTGASGVTSAYLNAKNRYFVAGCGTLVFNLIIIAMLQFDSDSVLGEIGQNKLLLLCIGVGLGALVRWASQVAVLPKIANNNQKLFLIDSSLSKSFFNAVLSSSLLLITPVLIRALASLTGEGAVAAFNYAQKLIELPVGVFFASLSTVALTKISQINMAKENKNKRMDIFVYYVQYSITLSIVIVVLGVWFSDFIVQLIYGRGKLDVLAIKRIVELFNIGLLALPMMAISLVATAYLNANKLNLLVLKISITSLFTLVTLILLGIFKSSETELMYAVVVFYSVNAFLLMVGTKLRFLGESALIDIKFIGNIGVSIIPVVIGIFIDYQIGQYNILVKLSLFSVTFLASFFIIARRFRGKS